eukprot:1153345-Pelagomonas_calceolata.AAC.11
MGMKVQKVLFRLNLPPLFDACPVCSPDHGAHEGILPYIKAAHLNGVTHVISYSVVRRGKFANRILMAIQAMASRNAMSVERGRRGNTILKEAKSFT